jgi:hypothetical protein
VLPAFPLDGGKLLFMLIARPWIGRIGTRRLSSASAPYAHRPVQSCVRNRDFRLAGLVAAGLSRQLGSGSGRASREN